MPPPLIYVENGSHLAIWDWINPYIQSILPIKVHNPTRFHKNQLKAFCIIMLLTYSQTDKHRADVITLVCTCAVYQLHC